jgi:hypothetical protein
MSCARAIEWYFTIGCADQILDAAGHREKLMFGTRAHSQEALSLSVTLQNVNGFVKKNANTLFVSRLNRKFFARK